MSNRCFPTKCELCPKELPLYLITNLGRPFDRIAFSFVPSVYLLTSTFILFTPNPTPLAHSTPQTPILWNVFSNFLVKDYLLKCTIHCRTKRDLPYELKDFAIITFDWGNGEKVLECRSIPHIIHYAPIKAFSNMHFFSNFRNIFIIYSRSLQKPIVTTKCSSPLV